VLDIDSTRVGTTCIAKQFFKWGRSTERIFSKQVEQFFRSGPQTRRLELLGVPLRLPGKD
jgi:hypothetical protein